MRLSDAATYMLIIDHDRAPDWDAGIAAIEAAGGFDELDELVEATMGGPSGNLEAKLEVGRELLSDAAKALASEWEVAADEKSGGSLVWEIRQVRDADAHILYDYWDNPCGLWPVAGSLGARRALSEVLGRRRVRPVIGETPHRRPFKSGVPELDAMLRKVRKQGGRIERGGHGIKVWGPTGQGPVVVTSSRIRVTAVRTIRGQLRRIGVRL